MGVPMALRPARFSDRRYEVRLSGSITNALLVAVVSYLREHWAIRTFAKLGSLFGLFCFSSAILFRDQFVGHIFGPAVIPGLTVSFGLLMFVVLAGRGFFVHLSEPIEVEERRKAEQEIGGSHDPFARLELDTKRLNEYYAINQSQARGSFRWAVFAMFCGFATIILGIWLFSLRPEGHDTVLTALSTIAGVAINVIAAFYLYLHNKTQRRSLSYFGQLVRLQQLGLAIRLARSHPTEQGRSEAIDKIIDELLTIVRLTTERDSNNSVKAPR